MPQEKRVISSLTEYPGTTTWREYEVLCPECKKWSAKYGDVSTDVDGEQHWLCTPCADAYQAEIAPFAHDAALAEEMFGADELEAYANKLRSDVG